MRFTFVDILCWTLNSGLESRLRSFFFLSSGFHATVLIRIINNRRCFGDVHTQLARALQPPEEILRCWNGAHDYRIVEVCFWQPHGVGTNAYRFIILCRLLLWCGPNLLKKRLIPNSSILRQLFENLLARTMQHELDLELIWWELKLLQYTSPEMEFLTGFVRLKRTIRPTTETWM